MIWNDTRIRAAAQAGMIEPFDERCLNPASYNLRLGNKIRIPRQNALLYRPVGRRTHHTEYLSAEMEYEQHIMAPGDFVLCHSLETVRIPADCVGILFSRSSMGRIGLEHLHAGYADPEFSGQLTFEFHNPAPWPILLEAGEAYMQIVFQSMVAAPERGYAETGRYQGQTGVTPARCDPLPR
jgi:dCTP deaminase